MFHFHIECEELTLLCSFYQNPLDSFCYEYSWLSSSHTSCLVPLSERAAVWEVVASLQASLIYPGTWGFCKRDAVQIMSAPHRLLLLCNPGGFSVHQGSFRCVRWWLQGFAVRGGESLREEGRGGGWGRERKESCVASLGFYCVSWCVTWQNLLKSHCFGAVCVGWVQIWTFMFCMISGYYIAFFSSCHSHCPEFPFIPVRMTRSLSPLREVPKNGPFGRPFMIKPVLPHEEF